MYRYNVLSYDQQNDMDLHTKSVIFRMEIYCMKTVI